MNSSQFQIKDDDGNTPLIQASKRGQLEVVQYLISVGVDTEARNSD
ncbi:hypothetical protein TVAG_108480 [Trichomonas vaginalis G3]|uniref:Uncharacterized protein n=1 Tax=Trichomonas vaginalis (strain ATCC PRA-98 / G3) TaxID=412133 RepID=A2EQH2_TRIV3|nr:Ankyrin repeat family [Trichomonas vaginalis G3]EAY05114.1 hypothetical protein TVAG_108480 [Trichomonas vaginalis G3]KAI5551457.1 Ankyrin repeat family [Trichomonas vaginalis G3]|eukprot:XP_001317337.1 hypothetical protein [Trichomonas vaginalis G3]